jgi:hypothetical protein
MNAINTKTTFDITAAATSPDANIFAAIHKAIRRGLADVLCQLGATDFNDPAAVDRVSASLEGMLAFCEHHLETEEHVVRPACGDKLVPEAFDRGHPVHVQLIAEVRSLFRALQTSSEKHRATLAHALYLHFSVFMADCLEHMAEEERVLLPLMVKTLGEGAVIAIRERILAAMPPAELAESARRMIVAGNPLEQRHLVRDIAAKAPRPVAVQLLQSTKPDLAEATYRHLMDIVEAASAT